MEKRVTNDDVAKFIEATAKLVKLDPQKISKDAYERLVLALTNEKYQEMDEAEMQMCVAESNLYATFNEKQKKLYSEFCEKRDAFYKKEAVVFKKELREEFKTKIKG